MHALIATRGRTPSQLASGPNSTLIQVGWLTPNPPTNSKVKEMIKSLVARRTNFPQDTSCRQTQRKRISVR